MLLAMIGFGLAVLPVCLTPGVSFTLVTRRVLDRGSRSGLLVIAGTLGGLTVHATLAGLGLSALVMSSATAFTVIKLAGAVYLVGLGVHTWWKSRAKPVEPVRRTLPWQGRGDFVQGFLGNVLNPKAASVYLTLAPQFIPAGKPILPVMWELCAAHLVVAGGWLLVWTAVVNVSVTVSRRTLRSARFRRVLDRVSGSVLIGLGVRTAVVAR